MLVHEGPARVFECEEDAIAAIKGGQIKEGDVVVIRYEGPKGGPGMSCLLYTSCCVSATQTGKEIQFFGARANLAKCLLYAINGGVDEKTGVQVGLSLIHI